MLVLGALGLLPKYSFQEFRFRQRRIRLWRKEGFGGGYVSFIVKSLSFIRPAPCGTNRFKTKGETNIEKPIRSRLVVSLSN